MLDLLLHGFQILQFEVLVDFYLLLALDHATWFDHLQSLDQVAERRVRGLWFTSCQVLAAIIFVIGQRAFLVGMLLETAGYVCVVKFVLRRHEVQEPFWLILTFGQVTLLVLNLLILSDSLLLMILQALIVQICEIVLDIQFSLAYAQEQVFILEIQ